MGAEGARCGTQAELVRMHATSVGLTLALAVLMPGTTALPVPPAGCSPRR